MSFFIKTLTIRLDNIVAIIFQKTISLPCQAVATVCYCYKAYIEKCLNYQLKKLIRVKTRQPMIPTPGIVFDKISMDIAGSLPTNGKYSYRLTIHDLLTKYSIVILFKRAISSEIAEGLDYRPRFKFHKLCDMSCIRR